MLHWWILSRGTKIPGTYRRLVRHHVFNIVYLFDSPTKFYNICSGTEQVNSFAPHHPSGWNPCFMICCRAIKSLLRVHKVPEMKLLILGKCRNWLYNRPGQYICRLISVEAWSRFLPRKDGSTIITAGSRVCRTSSTFRPLFLSFLSLPPLSGSFILASLPTLRLYS